MELGIVGLGLIGGSMAKAYKRRKATVWAEDINTSMMGLAKINQVIDGELTDENIGNCDLILIALTPKLAIEWLEKNSEKISKDTLVIDCCGTKKTVCEAGFKLAEKYGYTYAGGHPMAGTHNRGIKYSRANMFDGAYMVIVPPRTDDIHLLDRIKKALAPLNLAGISVTSAEKHDELIAFTSQLAHIVSNAYVKSPTVTDHKGFSAGSYKDLTRVASLNPDMWAELFLENRDNVIFELEHIISSLNEYLEAVKNNDFDTLARLLKEGSDLKERIDGYNGGNKA